MSYYYIVYDLSVVSAYKNKQNANLPYILAIISGIMLYTYMITNILALNAGGGIVMSIINLNLFITLIGGALLFGDNINYKIIGSLIGSLIFTSLALNESNKINI